MRFPACFLRAILTATFLIVGLVPLTVPRVEAQLGDVDPNFGNIGSAGALGLAGHVTVLALQPDGKLLVGGGIDGVARLNADGTTDTSFTANLPTTGVNARITALAVESDGKVLVGCDTIPVNGTAFTGLLRLNSDGSTDTSFTPSINPALISGIAAQSDGKILVVSSSAQSFDGNYFFTRLNSDGSTDSSFVGGNNLPANNPYDSPPVALVQSDGKIVVGAGGIVRLNPDGTSDSTFTPTYDTPVTSLALESNGELVVAGSFDQIDGVACNGLARLNSDGTLDTGFNYSGLDFPDLIAVQPDGRIVFYSDATLTRATFLLERVNTDGSLDTSFSVVADSFVYAVLAQADGSILFGGSFTHVNGFAFNSVAEINPDGSVNTAYTPDTPAGLNGPVSCFAVQPDGGIVVGGSFTEISGATHNTIGRLNSDGTPDTTFNASVLGDSNGASVAVVALQSDGGIVLGGSFNQVNGVAVQNLARLNSDGTLVTTFQGPAFGFFFDLAVQADDKIVVSGASPVKIGGGVDYYVERLKADGEVDGSFNVDIQEPVDTVAVQSDGKILVAGNLLQIGGSTFLQIFRLKSDGKVDPTFNASPDIGNDYTVISLAVQADGKILLGGDAFSTFTPAASYLYRLNADGSLDTGFNAIVDGTVSVVVAEADGGIVCGGSFTHVNSVPKAGLAHLNADGSLNPFVSAETGVSGTVGALAGQPDGNVLVGGNFTSVDGVPRNYVARLDGDATPDFFVGETPMGNGFYFLQFADGTPFGYYNLAGDGYAFPYFFHADLGMEYFIDAQDGLGGAYLYDFASSTFFYTSPGFPFPYLYDFTLNTVLYYFPDPDNPGHYNTAGVRYFYDFATDSIITK